MGTGPLAVIGVCVVVLGLLAILRGQSAMKGDIPKPVAALLVVAAVLVAGIVLYRITTAQPTADAGGGEAGMMMEQGGMGGGPGGPGGGMGGGMGGPNPHRDLGQLVRKLALLKSQDANAISTEQGAKLLPVLQALAAAEGMTTEEAEAKKAELEALLTPEQITALEGIELPRPSRGGGGPGGPGGGPRPEGGAAPGGEGALPAGARPPEGGAPSGMAPGGGAPGGGDWRAAMRARMLENPYVKELYDEQAAADPEFATDETKQNEFFRGLRNQLSPFLRGSSQEALQELVKALSPAE